MTEKQEQIALIRRAQYNEITRDYLFAIPNGGYRHLREAVALKAQGVKAGIPDLLLAYPSNGYHGFFIELKRPTPKEGGSKGELTGDQVIYLKRFTEAGYLAKAAWGWQQAWEFIENYLKQKEESK